MSIVVAVRKNGRTALASNSTSTVGGIRHHTDNIPHTQIVPLGTSLVGFTGWSVYEHILKEFASENKPPEFKDTQSVYLFFLGLWGEFKKERFGFVSND